MITCRELYDFILGYQSGELAPSQRKEFDAHLAICPSCVNYLDSYRKTVALGKAAYTRTEEPASGQVPEELIQAILAARKKKARRLDGEGPFS
ncbi:MAG: zf-HC2 domain-containing protein [Planctomycetes bacterium]|nr:zf-HC2 domain-containing protein [Planctomycetota bacterium]